MRAWSENSIRDLPAITRDVHPARSLSITHPHHPILHKHTWPVGVRRSLTTSAFCPVLCCGHRTRYVTEHPEAGGCDVVGGPLLEVAGPLLEVAERTFQSRR